MTTTSIPVPQALSAQRSPLWPVLFVLLALRLALIIPAQIGASQTYLASGADALQSVNLDPHGFPASWARFDAGFYLGIARYGYGLGAKELAFFPGYALLVRALSLGQPALMLWAGYLISNVAFVAAALLLWQLVEREHGSGAAWATVISLAAFPTALFWSALYAESTFLLLSVLTFWFTVRRQFWLAAVCVALASITRITGFMLVAIPLTEFWLARPKPGLVPRQPAFWVRAAGIALVSAVGLGGLCLYFWITQNAPLAFVNAQEGFWFRTVVWPWQTVLDAARVVATGYGGFETNWFMRVVSAQDLSVTLVFIVGTVLAALWLRRSLVIYQVVTLIFMLVSHGPYTFGLWSMSRVTIVLFPAFIAFGILLARWPRFKWAVWVVSYGLPLFLTALFANGRWVA